ncbi:C-C motif chemokine 20a.3 [Notothenia coriiceps]|uniref:C-C motif chemokine n=1 Tax=Notothenia coriiceps TaxID=8208 RepID=A0A6I9PA86_9TELE|nr:PREDICTED: C-C motif chemokine 20-like [Notothenia coriiceps]
MVSIKASVMVITLLTVCLLATNASSAHGCCRNYMKTKIPFPKIKGYSVQTVTELCPISAIIFHTKKGKACTDPALNWVMYYVDRLRNKAQMVHMKSTKAGI